MVVGLTLSVLCKLQILIVMSTLTLTVLEFEMNSVVTNIYLSELQ